MNGLLQKSVLHNTVFKLEACPLKCLGNELWNETAISKAQMSRFVEQVCICITPRLCENPAQRTPNWNKTSRQHALIFGMSGPKTSDGKKNWRHICTDMMLLWCPKVGELPSVFAESWHILPITMTHQLPRQQLCRCLLWILRLSLT